MAYDFLGVMHQRHWEALKAFTQSSVSELDPLLANRREALKRKIKAADKFLANLKEVHNYTAGSVLPYAKLGGGDPDLYEDADYPMVLDDAGKPGTIELDSGKFRGMVQKGELLSARHVAKLKSWQVRAIKFKKERIEYKIKRAYDLIDRLYRELDYLETIWPDQEFDSNGGIINPTAPLEIPEITAVDVLFNDPVRKNLFLYSGNVDPYDERGNVRDV